MTLQVGEQATSSLAAHVGDGFGIAVLLSASVWWEWLNREGHVILLGLGIVYALLRIVIALQEIRRNRRRERYRHLD